MVSGVRRHEQGRPGDCHGASGRRLISRAGPLRAIAAAGLAAALLVAGAARAQETPLGPAQERGEQAGGLVRGGLTFQFNYLSEGAWNLRGGERRLAVAAGQLTLGTTVDLGETVGLRGGRAQLTVTHCDGRDLSVAAGLDTLQEQQQVFCGHAWRLTQAWYDQRLFNDALDLKLGRLALGEDFASFSCEFQNQTFCGAPPGNLVGDYWYDWPVSQWAARVELKPARRVYMKFGIYDAATNNPKPSRGFSLGFGAGPRALVPVEVGFTPALGPGKLPGLYKLGGWWSARQAPDVLLDAHGEPRVLTGAPPLEQDGRHGVYAMLQQQVSGRAGGRGVTLFLNATQADRATSVTDRQLALGVIWLGPFRRRPDDEIALAVGQTHVNSRIAAGQALVGAPEQGSETVAELDYCIEATKRLTFRPNLQVVHHPAGLSDRRDAVVLGLRAVAGF